MKQYFTKYLPVEGEIKEGDSCYITTLKDYKNKTGYRTLVVSANDILISNIKSAAKVMNPQKVKLFLCSSYFTYGDTVIDPNTLKEYVVSDLGYEEGGFFRKIGPISSGANWVKEGDEFEENEIKIISFKVFSHFDPTVQSSPAEPIYKDKEEVHRIELLCPNCNTFH